MVKTDNRHAGLIRAGAAGLMAALLAGPAGAQLSAEGGPIRVNAETSSVLERERKVVVSGNVDIIQGDARLRANEVTLFYSGRQGAANDGLASGFGDIRELRAIGDVFYVTPDLKATGSVGAYDAASDTITLSGTEDDKVILIRGEDVAEGCELTLQVSEGRSNLKGCGERGVRILINPETGETADADASPQN